MPRLSSIAPMNMTAIDRTTVAGWLGDYNPRHARLYRIRPWRYRTERGAAAGRAAVRIVPPDSLRFDYQGPFGQSGRAAVVADSALWVVPPEDIRGLVTFAPLFWTALGLPPSPPAGAVLRGLTRPELRAWRYIVAGDTLDFVLRGTPATLLQGELRRAGRIIGQTVVELDPKTGLAVKSRIDFPWDTSRFEFTIETVDTLATFESSIWAHQ